MTMFYHFLITFNATLMMKLPKSCIETKKYFCFMNETICSNAGVGRDQPCV